jgi:signal transduction histidine kinase
MTNLSIRWRLTLWWAGLFLLCSLLLLASVNVFVQVSLSGVSDQVDMAVRLDPVIADELAEAVGRVRRATLLSLALLVVAAGAVGWWLSGRMLAPVRTITETARHISDSNLGDRIAASGPHDELRELAEAFDGMLARLEAGFEAQRSFAADASHELRTPLTRIRAELDVTLDDPEVTPAELVEASDSIRRALDQSEQLIDRLLQLASAEAIRERQPVPLDDLVRSSLDEAERADGVEVDLHLQPVCAYGDATLLGRMVDNLIHNALRYNQPRGWVQASTHAAGGWVHLIVANSGPHLTDDQLARLTGRFYRPDTARARTSGGTGLGLAIVDAVVGAHHGQLVLDQVLGGGLHVEVVLPAPPASSPAGLTAASEPS